jgi:hypothetical protein
MTRLITLSTAIALCSSLAFGQAPAGNQSKASAPPDREQLERRFAETMSGATLVGHFTTAGKESETPKAERYTLGKVSKLKDDLWQFETRIQYGDHDLKVPLAINVLWAGDTPVISLTKLAIPGLGTFTARVLVYEDQYAGTWSAGDHGGHLFGKLERAKEKPGDDKPKQ